MAYPDGINNGVCPSSHPVHLISIFYEIYFSVDPFNKLNAGGNFVLSTGDPTGYSLHGDFYNGWNQDVLQQAVDQCTNDSGVLEDCGVFTGQNLIISDDDTNTCSAKDPVGVNVDGMLPYHFEWPIKPLQQFLTNSRFRSVESEGTRVEEDEVAGIEFGGQAPLVVTPKGASLCE